MDSSKPVILVAESDGFSGAAAAVLARIGKVILADLNRAVLLRAVGPTEVLWVRLRHRIDAELLDRAPRLKLIVSPTTGLNHIDLDEAMRRGITVLSLRGETDFLKEIHATAEHTLALILALARHLPTAHQHVLDGGWNRDEFCGHELQGKTAGVIGYGRLGTIVARLLRAFGVTVLAHDPHVPHADVPLVGLMELLNESDLVTLHVNYTPQTRRFFGAAEFAQMKRSAWFINTARGELVDELALLGALQTGRLAGAALDVLSDEQAAGMGQHPLVQFARQRRNLIITPHIGGCTVESMAKTELFMAQKLAAALNARPAAVEA